MKEDVKILLAEDSSTVRETTRAYLARMGFKKIMEARDGAAAWKRLQTMKPDLVVSDWDMPEMDGLELLKKTRADEKLTDLPFILLTAQDDKDRIVEAIKAGATDYIVKPIDRRVLAEKINKILKNI